MRRSGRRRLLISHSDAQWAISRGKAEKLGDRPRLASRLSDKEGSDFTHSEQKSVSCLLLSPFRNLTFPPLVGMIPGREEGAEWGGHKL